MADDKRLIEHYLPIEAIPREARREKSVRKGHISTLHLCRETGKQGSRRAEF